MNAEAARTIGRVEELSEETFDRSVLDAARPVVVDFWAPWCRPCQALEPTLAELADTYAERLAFARVNVDSFPTVAARYGVLTLPTVVLFADGEPQAAVAGVRTREHYERVWQRWLGDTV